MRAYSRPRSGSASRIASSQYCGLWRDFGTVRMSTTHSTPWARSSAAKSSIGRVEWPTVNTVAAIRGSCHRRLGGRATALPREVAAEEADNRKNHGSFVDTFSESPSGADARLVISRRFHEATPSKERHEHRSSQGARGGGAPRRGHPRVGA